MKSLLPVLLLLSAPALADDPFSTLGEGASDDRDQDEGVPLERDRADETESYIVNGEATLAFPQVAALSVQYSSFGDTYCSATLVSPTELITAAHCVDSLAGNARNGAQNFAVFGGNIEAGEISFASEIVDWGSHPSWSGDVEGGGDIAWIRMAEPNTLVEPVGLFGGGVNSLQAGELFDFVGFGITSDGRNDGGTKRTAAIPFQSVRGAYLISRDATKNVCSGDSGGAALRREGDEQWSLVGVNSFVSDDLRNDRPCSTGSNGATRIDLYRDWIMEFTDATTELAEPVDPDQIIADSSDKYGDWALPQRPPEKAGACDSVNASSLGGLGLLLGGLMFVRRRQS